MTENPPAIGIDLGTTYSCVAVFQYGKVEIIANDQGSHTTPSYVAFTDKERFIGGAAKDQIAENPLNTVYDIKRLIGRQFNEENVQKDRKQFSYQVINKNGNPKISVRFKKEEQTFAPEEISAMILGKMKEIAEDFVGCEVRDAVITVPAYFDDAQRKATKVAGTIAGLNVLRIINEPTAAAIAYGLEQKSLGDKNVLIFDLGGGTFDVSILTIGDGIFKVNSTAGDTHLGGEDFNTQMVTHFVEIIDQKYEKDIQKDSRAMQKLRTACEQAKLALSSETQTFVHVESLFPGIDFKSQITRAKFESLCRDQFESTLDLVEKALKDANNMKKSDIDEVILVGGSTRIPYIQKILQKYFDGKELNKSINPDEAVAYGAAVQAAILSGDMSSEIEDILLVDVTPLSLGVRTAEGTMTNIIDRNSTIPTSGTKIFTTTADNQKSVNIQIFEGERAMTDDNYLLAEFKLTDIPPADRKVPQIEVTFDIDTDGILNVSAVEKNSGKQNKITIENDRRHLSKVEIDRMVKDSEKFRIADAQQRDKVVAQSSLKEYAYQLQTIANRSDFSTQMSIEEQKIVLNKGEEVFEWLKSNTNASKHDCDEKMKETSKVCSEILNKYKEKLKSNPNNNVRVGTNRTTNETSDDTDTNINPVIEELN